MPSPIKTPTPRTDEFLENVHDIQANLCFVSFARQLETELAEAKRMNGVLSAQRTRAFTELNLSLDNRHEALCQQSLAECCELRIRVIALEAELLFEKTSGNKQLELKTALRSSLAASQERVRELEDALAPFAKFLFGARSVWAGAKDSDVVLCGYSDAVSGETTGVNVTMGDFRKARALLKPNPAST